MVPRVRPALTIALFVALASPAAAAERPLPWAGGQEVVSELEATLAAAAGEFTKKPASIYCQGNYDWATLAAQGRFDPANVWGYVPVKWSWASYSWEPVGYSHFSEQACLYLDGLLAAADKHSQKECQAGTRAIYEDRSRSRVVWKTRTVTKPVRVRVNGKLVWRERPVRTRVRTVEVTTVSVKVRDEPIFATCADWTKKLWAYQTFSHETMHLYGIDSERDAECYGMQALPWFMARLGVDSAFARDIATDVWNDIYLRRPANSAYVSGECRDGGRLDLVPGSTSWPAGY